MTDTLVTYRVQVKSLTSGHITTRGTKATDNYTALTNMAWRFFGELIEDGGAIRWTGPTQVFVENLYGEQVARLMIDETQKSDTHTLDNWIDEQLDAMDIRTIDDRTSEITIDGIAVATIMPEYRHGAPSLDAWMSWTYDDVIDCTGLSAGDRSYVDMRVVEHAISLVERDDTS